MLKQCAGLGLDEMFPWALAIGKEACWNDTGLRAFYWHSLGIDI